MSHEETRLACGGDTDGMVRRVRIRRNGAVYISSIRPDCGVQAPSQRYARFHTWFVPASWDLGQIAEFIGTPLRLRRDGMPIEQPGAVYVPMW